MARDPVMGETAGTRIFSPALIPVQWLFFKLICILNMKNQKAKMKLSAQEKDDIKRQIVANLQQQSEIDKIVVFGSFLTNEDPNDIDIAIFQSSNENYLTLSLKYRKSIRDISKIIPVDIIPLLNGKSNYFIQSEIETGEIIYER